MIQNMNIAGSDFEISAPLALPLNEVQVWRADLESLRADESRWLSLLSADEKARAARFHFPVDRQRFAAARALLRTILAAYLNSDPRQLTFLYSPKEKPSLAPPHAASGVTFNVSHSGGVAMYAFSRKRDLGIDVEQVRRNSDIEAIARRFFSTHEQTQFFALPAEERVAAFFRCWTRKEAYLKATGDGLSLPLSQFDVLIEAESRNALAATRPDPAEAGRWHLSEVPAVSGYVAALCVQGHDWKLKDWTESSPISL